jgi:hypothetical protein
MAFSAENARVLATLSARESARIRERAVGPHGSESGIPVMTPERVKRACVPRAARRLSAESRAPSPPLLPISRSARAPSQIPFPRP